MFRKDEQARAEWSEENVRICADRQQMILDHAAVMLRPGGRLVYSTCTFSPEEDEDGIAEFLKRHPEFSVAAVPEEKRLPGLSAGHSEWCSKPCPSAAGSFRIWPHLAEGEGHFLVLLEKSSDSEIESTEGSRKIRQPKFWNDKNGKKLMTELLQEILKEQMPADRLILFGDQVYQVPEGMPAFDGLRRSCGRGFIWEPIKRTG